MQMQGVFSQENLNSLKTKRSRFLNHNSLPLSKIPITCENIFHNKEIGKLNEIPKRILKKIDLIIDYGEIKKSPTANLDLTKKIPSIIIK